MALLDSQLAQRRHFSPAQRGGEWFDHMTADRLYSRQRSEAITQRVMWPRSDCRLSSLRSPRVERPPPTPMIVTQRLKDLEGKDKGEFSAHANRHALEYHGEFFDQSLGRRKDTYNRWQHKPSQSLSWVPSPSDNSSYSHPSICQTSYQGPFTTQQDAQRIAKQRRFRQSCPPEEVEYGRTNPSTTTTEWSSGGHRTSLALLSKSQEPRLCPNTWRYATHRYTT